jgi:hypothetical protein
MLTITSIDLTTINSFRELAQRLDDAMGFPGWCSCEIDDWVALTTSLDRLGAATVEQSVHSITITAGRSERDRRISSVYLHRIFEVIANVNRRATELAGRPLVALIVT